MLAKRIWDAAVTKLESAPLRPFQKPRFSLGAICAIMNEEPKVERKPKNLPPNHSARYGPSLQEFDASRSCEVECDKRNDHKG